MHEQFMADGMRASCSLGAQMSAPAVVGIQSQGVIANAKHFGTYAQTHGLQQPDNVVYGSEFQLPPQPDVVITSLCGSIRVICSGQQSGDRAIRCHGGRCGVPIAACTHHDDQPRPAAAVFPRSLMLAVASLRTRTCDIITRALMR